MVCLTVIGNITIPVVLPAIVTEGLVVVQTVDVHAIEIFLFVGNLAVVVEVQGDQVFLAPIGQLGEPIRTHSVMLKTGLGEGGTHPYPLNFHVLWHIYYQIFSGKM